MAVELTLFARAPVPGRTKTRLAKTLGEVRAARLYEAFLGDIVSRLAPLGALELACAGDLEHPALRRLAERHALPLRAQVPGDLGARMAHSLREMRARGGAGVIVGTDVPTLPAELVARARVALEGAADVVLGPTADGGYYLVGVRETRIDPSDLFRDVRFSTRFAFADTLAAACRAGCHVAVLPPWYDVDEVDDLLLLEAHLALDRGAAPVTAATLFDRPAAGR